MTGYLVVDPRHRDRVVDLSRPAVEAARRTTGCLDFAVSPDPVDPARVNIAERWESRTALERFRGAGPAEDLDELVRDARVVEIET